MNIKTLMRMSSYFLSTLPRQTKTERGYRLSEIGKVLSLFGLPA